MTHDTDPPSFRLISGTELLAMTDPPIVNGQTWGPWRLNARNLTLHHRWYEIDLKACTTSAKVLDLIVQVTRKTWCSVEEAGHLLAALRALLDPQRTLCSCGQDRPFNPTAHLKAVIERKGEDQ